MRTVVIIAILLLTASILNAQTYTFYATDDAWVKDGDIANNGSSNALRVRATIRYSYLKFTISGLAGATIESATLNIRTQNNPMDDTTVYAVADTSWTELTINGVNEPPMGAALDTIAPIDANTWYQFDVSAALVGEGTYSFGLMTTENNGQLDWQSNNTSDIPELIITVFTGNNEPPVFDVNTISMPNAIQDVDYNDTIAGSATDPNGDPITYSKESGPDWLNVAANGSLTGTPGVTDVGANAWVVRAADDKGAADTATLEIIVDPAPNNDPQFESDPVLANYAVAGVRYYDSLAIDVNDHDIGQRMSFSIISGSAWLVVDGNGFLGGVPAKADMGLNLFTVRVEDDRGGFDEANLNIQVRGNADIDGDSQFNFEDFSFIAANWMNPCSDPDWCGGADIDLSGMVDSNDLAALTERWLGGVNKRKNIVLIMSDDVSPDLYGCYGNTLVSTPNIDAMAQNGVMFKSAWATALCSPTRAMIMTGRYGYRTGFYHNSLALPQPDGNNELLKYHHSFGKLMKQAGYATAIAGKWHLSASTPESADGGFEEYCLWSSYSDISKLPGSPIFTGAVENDDTTARYWHPAFIKDDVLLDTEPNDFGPDIEADFVIDFIERKTEEGKPFLAYWPMVAPHGTRQGITTTPFRGAVGDIASHPEPEKSDRFRALNEYIDFCIGRVQQRVNDLGIAGDTIFIYCSDNGTAGTAKSRGVERGCRVVFVASGGGLEQRGATNEITDLADILPTLLDYAGVDLPLGYEIDGHSLKPFLMGETDSHRDWIYSNIGATQLLRTRDFMLEAANPVLGIPDGRFYDCTNSPDQNGVGYVNLTNLPVGAYQRDQFTQTLSQLPPLDVNDPHFSTQKGIDFLSEHIASLNKHIHNHADYQFYNEEVPLVAGDVTLSGGGSQVPPGGNMLLSWDTSSVAGLAGNEASYTFSWWHDGTVIPGQTLAALSLASVTAADAGRYEAVAADGMTTYVSLPIDITIGN